MTQLRHTPFLVTAFILAALAAGCAAGGGNHSPIPGSPPVADAARHRQRVGAKLQIHIPRHHRRKRGSKYVSPNTQSITVGVQLATTSPWPSMPPQTLVVNTPKPCTVVPGGGGYNCTFNVRAFVGNDVFTFAEYAVKSPTPQDTPLAVLTSPVTNVASGTQLAFTLEGVVNRVALSVPNPESTSDAASNHTQPIPIGTPATFALTIAPQDASGATIATDTFSSPITISVSPATSGVSLALAKKCAGDTATAAKVTINCADDLNQVSVAYDGTVAAAGTGYVDKATIVASPQLSSPTPQPAVVALTSNIVAYQIAPVPSGASFPYVDLSNMALDPTTGTFVVAASYNNANPALIEFDPNNPGGATNAPIGFSVTSLTFDTAGKLWTNDETSSVLHCFAGITSTPATVNVSDANGVITAPQVAEDGSGNIWYTGSDESYYPAAGYFADSCANGSQTAQIVYGASYENPYSIALAQPSGGLPGISVPAGGSGAHLYTLYTNTGSSPPPTAAWPANQLPNGIVNDPSYNAYTATYPQLGTNGLINQIAAGSSTIGVFQTLQPQSEPYAIAQYSGSHATAQSLLVSDDFYGGAILTSPAATTTEPLELVAPKGIYCGPVAYDKNGGAWAVCAQADGSLWAYRLAVTSTWGALPNALVFTSPFNSVVTLAETSGTDSSPFTVTGNSNPSVIAIGTPWPATPAFPHAIPIQVQQTGVAALTIVDRHGRVQTLDITVTPSGLPTAAPTSPPRPHERPRHGRPRAILGRPM